MPAGGQYISVPMFKALDTTDGTGGVPVAPLAGAGTLTFSVAGTGGVPAGVPDVYVEISALSPAASGALEDYDPDDSNPGIWTVPFNAGESVTVGDMVRVSSAGTISVTNASSGATDVQVSVLGYIQNSGTSITGDTYLPLPYAGLVDTRTGYGAPQAQIPAGGNLTVQITGGGGVPSDAAGAALYLGAANATHSGWISAYAPGGTDPALRALSYSPGQKVRNLYLGPVSSSGTLTLVNHGSAAVDMMVAAQGYLVSPSASEAGSTYQDVPQSRIIDTRNGTGGVSATPIPANGSITFTVVGDDSIPSNGVTAVAETVAAMNATASGFLSLYPAGGTDPGNAAVNFTAGDNQDNDLTAAEVSAVSVTGQQTIANHSSGTVDVVVAARGFFVAPYTPDAPAPISVTTSGSAATVSWAPTGDGGAAITSYTVSASPDSATVTVSGNVTQATLTGLANAAGDAFTVTATNAVGTGDDGVYAPPGAVTGTVLAPNGTPVAGDQVTLYVADPPADDPSSWTPSAVGTATTDANGIWVFQVPSYSALPADAQSAADSNGGWLNLDASATAFSTVGSVTYSVGADAERSAWVGSSAQPSGPVQVSSPAGGQPAMIVTPDQADLSSGDTTSGEDSTPNYEASPTLTDANNDIVGDAQDAYDDPSEDSYGYEPLFGTDGNYSPYVAADGTSLAGASASPDSPASPDGVVKGCTNPKNHPGDGYVRKRFVFKVWEKHAYTIYGEVHSNWDTTGSLTFDSDAATSIGVDISADAQLFHFDYYKTWSNSQGSSAGLSVPAYTAEQLSVSLNYEDAKVVDADVPSGAPYYPPVGGETAYVCKTRWTIGNAGIYNPGNGWQPLKTSANIWGEFPPDGEFQPDGRPHEQSNVGYDGYKGYSYMYPDSSLWSNAYGNNNGAGGLAYCDTKGKGFVWGLAASVGGVGITVEQDHSTDASQCINFGGATRTNEIKGTKNSGLHYIWGNNGIAGLGHFPEMFYSY